LQKKKLGKMPQVAQCHKKLEPEGILDINVLVTFVTLANEEEEKASLVVPEAPSVVGRRKPLLP
jgi:hypothetical protein